MHSRSSFARREHSSLKSNLVHIATRRFQLSTTILLITILLSDRCFPSFSFVTSSIFTAPPSEITTKTATLSGGGAAYIFSRQKTRRNCFSCGASRSSRRNHNNNYRAGTFGTARIGSGSLQDSRISSVKMSSSAATTQENTHETKKPNWNIIQNPENEDKANEKSHTAIGGESSVTQRNKAAAEEEIDRILQERCVWSESQYQESLELYDKFMSCTDSYVETGIKKALNCLDHAYRLYGPGSVLCSFNGGKDAVVILNLVRAAHAHYYNHTEQHQSNTKSPKQRKRIITRPRVIYFDHKDEFPEMISYLYDSVHTYDLDMICFDKGIKFQDGLSILVDNNKYPMIVNPPEQGLGLTSSTNLNGNSNDYTDAPPFPMAFVLGTRGTDPNAGNQGEFAPSSHYMPPFMRVNPILDWSYGLVWHFLRLFQLPYCPLYDQGYTSLGTTKDTLPCPALAVPGVPTSATITAAASNSSITGLPKYWPAYMLRDWDQERAGRIKKPKKGKTNNGDPTVEAKEQAAKLIDIDGDKATLELTSTALAVDESLMSASIISGFQGPSSLQEGKNASMLSPELSVKNDALGRNSHSNDYSNRSPLSYASSSDNYFEPSSTYGMPKTVGLVIIGDEILKGFTADTNTQAASKALRQYNVRLERVAVISDNQDKIVKEILSMQNEVDFIITSGGVGPTHDDVTIKSVAKALDQDMVLHKEMAKLLRDKMKDTTVDTSGSVEDDDNKEEEDETLLRSKLTEAQIKMAMLPANSKLKYLSDDKNDWPVLQARNVFLLPGVPEFFEKKIDNIANYLSVEQGELSSSLIYKVVLKVHENSIVSILNQAVKKHSNVTIGSYPFVSHPEFKTVLTLEANIDCFPNSDYEYDHETNSSNVNNDQENDDLKTRKNCMDEYVRLALDDLRNMLPDESILYVDNENKLSLT